MLGSHQNPLWNWMESSKKETFLELIHRETQGLEQRFKQKNWSDMFLIKFWLLYEDPYIMAYYNRYRIGVVQSPNSKQPEFLVIAQFCWASWNLFVHPNGGITRKLGNPSLGVVRVSPYKKKRRKFLGKIRDPLPHPWTHPRKPPPQKSDSVKNGATFQGSVAELHSLKLTVRPPENRPKRPKRKRV